MAAPMVKTGGRKPTGQVVEIDGKRGRTFAIRFRSYGKRHYFTLGTVAEGWSRDRAQAELDNVLADIRRGIWREPDPASDLQPRMPMFGDYADAWLAMRAPELRESTIERNRYSLVHLRPTFGDMPLDAITVADVNAYRTAKLREGKLGADSINKTLKLLAQVLDYAVEDDELIERNVAKGKRRRLKVDRPRRTWLDTADQVVALIDAASDLNRRVRPGRDRAMIATLVFSGLRIGELLDLRRGDVDLASGRIRVRSSKTDAGERDVNLLPVLRDELSAYLARTDLAPDAYLFGTRTGARESESNVRSRVVAESVKGANAILAADNRAQINDRITPHSLRRTFASILVSIGEDPVYVMGQLGHSDPAFTLRVYAQLMNDRSGERDRIRAVVNGEEWAEMGRNGDSGRSAGEGRSAEKSRNPALEKAWRERAQ
ncbi:MAG: tyrosine-type recombinase/integrase [Actinobacteria bacterium]|nr:tyrosine-type recombinase/integrase [Actinomycetota bacterium]